MFEVPRTAGGHPRIVIAAAVAALLGAAGLAGVRTSTIAPEPAHAATPAPRTRPAPTVVLDLPELAERLQREGDAGRFSGGVLVARGDQVLFRQVYGMANYERHEPLQLDTRFRLASDSKQFTAAAILKLQDEGKLTIGDPLCKWIQPCPKAWAPIRLHHLLTHTSGIPDLMAQEHWGLTRVTPSTPEQLTEAAARYRLQFPPGTKIRYDNAGYNLLAVVVSKASGVPFETYLQREILDPLDLKDTGSDAAADATGLAMGYANFPGGLTAQPNANVSVVFGAGALYSTLDDLLVWTRALHHGQVISPYGYAQMTGNHNPPDTPKERGRPARAWGYGLYTNSLGQRVNRPFPEKQIYHTGSWSGFRNLISYQPDNDITVVVLSNNYHQRDQVFLISQQAMAEALGRPFPTAMTR